MPTSPGAIERFLEYMPLPPPIQFRGAPRERLLREIYAIGTQEPLFKTEPYAHQLEGLAFALWAERALLFFEMRTGKTKIALDWISYLIYSELLKKKALIIAHAPIAVDEWESQARRHSYLNVLAIRSGGYTAENFFYELRHNSNNFDVLLISWSTLQVIFGEKGVSRKGKAKVYADRPLLREVAAMFDAVVIDEIHQAGNYSTLRHIIGSEITNECRYRLGLTGTPMGRDPMLLWGQAALIDGGKALGSNFYFFRECFSKKTYNKFKKFNNVDYTFDRKKLPVLRDKMSAMTLHCALKDVVDLDILRGVVSLGLSPEQSRYYDQAVERLVQLAMGQTVEIENIFIRLLQISSGFLPYEDANGNRRVIDFPDAAKFVWLEDFIENLPDDLPLVVFVGFTHSLNRAAKIMADHGKRYDTLHGGTQNRPQLLERFRTGETTVLIANYAVGGMAVDMSAANVMTFFELPSSGITYAQASARASARGDRPLVIDNVVCSPIEQKLLDYLTEGENMREVLLRDPRRLAEAARRR